MRVRSLFVVLALLAGALILAPPGARADPKLAQDKKKTDTEVKKADTPLKLEPGKGARVEAELTADDPKDKVRTTSRAKTYEVALKAGKAYQIDMITKSPGFDPYLRLEDPAGKQVAQDDDSGGFPNARILYTPEKEGTYKIVATTFAADMTGKYLLTIREASAAVAALTKLRLEFRQEQGALFKEYGQATTQDQKDKIEARFYESIAKYVEHMAKFAEKHAADPVARQAQMEMRQGIQGLGMANSPAVTRMLRGLLAKTTEKDLKGQIAVVLGQSLRNQSEKAYQKKDKAGSVKLAKESEELFEQAIKDSGGSGPMAQQAKEALYELKHLAVGKKAPDIEGEDLDGKKFKLSDYRGKVVVLDFWGNW